MTHRAWPVFSLNNNGMQYMFYKQFLRHRDCFALDLVFLPLEILFCFAFVLQEAFAVLGLSAQLAVNSFNRILGSLARVEVKGLWLRYSFFLAAAAKATKMVGHFQSAFKMYLDSEIMKHRSDPISGAVVY